MISSSRRRRFLPVAPALWLAAGCATPLPADCLSAIFFDLGDTLVDTSGSQPYPNFPSAQATIDALQARGLRLGIITNVPAGWDRDDLEAILAEPEFLDEFDVLVLSSQAPAPKPNPLIYTHAHQQLPTPRPAIANTAFVGESLAEIANSATNPSAGARAVGMVGIHLSGAAPSPLADFTIGSLEELPALETGPCRWFADDFELGDFDAWSACTGCS